MGRGHRLEQRDHGRPDVKSGLTVEAGPARCCYALSPQDRPGCQLTATVAYGAATLCSACERDRSTLGKGYSPRRLPGTTDLDALALLDEVHAELIRAVAQLPAAVVRAPASITRRGPRSQPSWEPPGRPLNNASKSSEIQSSSVAV